MRFGDPADTEEFGLHLARLLVPGDVIALEGQLGAGKTTLARGLLRGLGFSGDVASPTFPIVLVYDETGMRMPVWHVDLYRVADSGEIAELGLDDARDEGALLIEWPERLGNALWPESLYLSLTIEGDGTRALTARVPPAWEDRWPQ